MKKLNEIKDSSEMSVSLEGHIEHITFVNEESGYTVVRVNVPSRREPVTVVGNILNPTPGERVLMKGEWTYHQKFGEQFRCVFCESFVPATLYGIEKYLGSGLIKGIGAVMAKRIVDKFGKDTLDIIESDSFKLLEVEGIGEKRIVMIRNAWEEQREVRAIMLFLHNHGVGAAYASRIFRQYGNAAIRILQDNPYRLATDILGIGFITADRIAEKMGFAKDSFQRAEAGILYILHELADEGHVYYPYELLIRKCREILDIDTVIMEHALKKAAEEKNIIIEDQSAFSETVPERPVYLAKYYLYELQTAKRLKDLMNTSSPLCEIDPKKTIKWIEEKLSVTLAEKQIEAIRAATTNKLLVVTGGPGTGKTTIINAIIHIFSELGKKVLLAAPTGRAAKKMSEATGREAKTIHRLLEYRPQKGGFQKDEKAPLDCDVLIVDEASMIDTFLMYNLMIAIPAETTFILVGDVDQLPSVGAGSVLKDVIISGEVPVIRLTEIFRQAKKSSIILNAHRINDGKMPRLQNSHDRLDDFYFVEQDDPEKVVDMIIRLVKERIPQRFGFDPLEDIQVITPMHRGLVGAGNMNIVLQRALNYGEEGIHRGGRFYRVGDKVMQIRNNYDRDVYNGDIGRIVNLDDELQEATLVFDGRDVVYEYSDLDEIILSYAVSVHKSQGAEYPAVVMPLLMQHYMLLQRNLLYTAVTRGKKLVVIVGEKKAFAIAVQNNQSQKRFSLLSSRLVAV